MKKVTLILFVLVFAVGGYLWFTEPDRFKQLFGEKPPANPNSGEPSKGKPAAKESRPTEPKPRAVKMVRIEFPESVANIFVNGALVQGTSLEMEPGPVVVASYDNGTFSQEVLQLSEGSVQPKLNRRPSNPSPTWDSFQGNLWRTGHVEAKDRQDLTPAWQVNLDDKTSCSPIIIGNQAYFSSSKHLLTALNLETGAVVWRQGSLGSSVSPIANSQFVFAGSNSGNFEAYRLKDGKKRGDKYLNSYPTSLALISEEAFLVTTKETKIFNIKTKKSFTGKLPLRVNWDRETEAFWQGASSPVIADDKAIFQTEAAGLMAISLNNGEQIWPKQQSGAIQKGAVETMSFDLGSFFQTATPATDGTLLFAAQKDNIQAVSTKDGNALWQKKHGSQITSSVSFAHGQVYLGTEKGTILALSAIDGSQIFERSVSEKPIFASPVLFKDKLLVATQEGRLHLLNGFTGNTLASNDALAGAAIVGTPAVSGNVILAINKKGKAVCFR